MQAIKYRGCMESYVDEMLHGLRIFPHKNRVLMPVASIYEQLIFVPEVD